MGFKRKVFSHEIIDYQKESHKDDTGDDNGFDICLRCGEFEKTEKYG